MRKGDVKGAASGVAKGTGQTVAGAGKGVGKTVDGLGKGVGDTVGFFLSPDDALATSKHAIALFVVTSR